MEVKEMLTCTFRSIDILQVMKCYCDSYTLRVVHVLHQQTQSLRPGNLQLVLEESAECRFLLNEFSNVLIQH